MIALANRFAHGVEEVIAAKGLPWIVKQLGCRAEYWFCPQSPRNGGEAAAAVDPELDRYIHLAALNRGILLTPFHNMALMSPATAATDVDFHTQVFRESAELLLVGRLTPPFFYAMVGMRTHRSDGCGDRPDGCPW